LNRRRFLMSAGVAAAGVGLWAARPRVLGRGGHSEYFRSLEASLHASGIARPVMLVDLDRLDQNIEVVRKALGPRGLRIVAKSLPSPKLIEYVLGQADTERVMVFHQPFANAVASLHPDADVLFGKPMPVAATAEFYERLPGGAFDAARQMQWLVDTPERLRQYASLASARNLQLRINLEIDVGLHRGGVNDPTTLSGMLDAIAADERLEFGGLMGYEPHVVKMPAFAGGPEGEFARVQERYAGFLDVVQGHSKTAHSSRELTLNAAGSPTYRLWRDVEGLSNELSVGSGLVKPLDFDLPILEEHVPALYIATPVLKTREGLEVPGLGSGNGLWSAWDPNRAQSFFTYGGNWKAKPVSPAGLLDNPVFGHSSNQEMLNGSAEIALAVDDFVFLRPTQSEFVMLQFGDLIMVRGEEIVDAWSVLDQSGEVAS